MQKLPNPAPHGGRRSRAQIRYIVLHGAAEGSMPPGTSVHYLVDEEHVQRCVPVRVAAWHCGTRGAYFHPYCRNANSIGIAMCTRRQAGRETLPLAAARRAQALVRALMARYGIPPENVLRHYDVTHKTCPVPLVERAADWAAFRAALDGRKNAESGQLSAGSSDESGASSSDADRPNGINRNGIR